MTRLRFLVVMVALTVACAAPQEEQDSVNVVASFIGGQLTVEEVDAGILALSSEERRAVGESSDSAFEDFIRELVLDRILLADPELLSLYSSPDVQRELQIVRRQVVAEEFLTRQNLELEVVTDDDIAARFDERYAGRGIPERRFAYHLFRSLGSGASKEDLRSELQSIRQRVLDGESFSILARELSDSESRHADGAIGWVERGQLTPDLERLLFGLTPGVPSDPVNTHDGVHLFLVEMVFGGGDYLLEDMRMEIGRELVRERRLGRANEILDGIVAPPGSVIRSLEEVIQGLQLGEADLPALRIADFELSFAELAKELTEQRSVASPGTSPRQQLEEALLTHRSRELIYQHCRTAGFELSLEAERRRARREDRMRADQARQHLLGQSVRDQEDELRRFYDDNCARFSRPLRVRISRLRIPLGEGATEYMRELEMIASLAPATVLADLADRFDGAVRDLGLQTLAVLSVIGDGKLAYFAGSLPVGALSPPFHDQDAIWMIRVEERVEPEPAPFDEVRSAVSASFLERHGQRLYDDLVNRVVGELKLHPAGLKQIRSPLSISTNP